MAYLLQILVVVISLRIKLGANKQITQLAWYTMIGPKQKGIVLQNASVRILKLCQHTEKMMKAFTRRSESLKA